MNNETLELLEIKGAEKNNLKRARLMRFFYAVHWLIVSENRPQERQKFLNYQKNGGCE